MSENDGLLVLAAFGYGAASVGLYLAAGWSGMLIAAGVLCVFIAGAGLHRDDS